MENNRCNGKGAFGVFDGQFGCALADCECGLLLQCNEKLGFCLTDKKSRQCEGQCELSSWSLVLVLLVLLVLLAIPIWLIYTRRRREQCLQNSTRPTDETTPLLLASSWNIFHLTKVDTSVIKLRRKKTTPSIALETMSKGKLSGIFYFLVVSFIICFANAFIRFPYERANLVLNDTTCSTDDCYFKSTLSKDNSAILSTTSSIPLLKHHPMFLSVSIDFPSVKTTSTTLTAKSIRQMQFDYSISVSQPETGIKQVDAFVGYASSLCSCNGQGCEFSTCKSITLINVNIYDYDFASLKNQVLSIDVKASLPNNKPFAFDHVNVSTQFNSTFHKLIGTVKVLLFVVDILCAYFWICALRNHDKSGKLQWEHHMISVLLVMNLFNSLPLRLMLSVFNVWWDGFARSWFVVSCALWILFFLFALDHQRKFSSSHLDPVSGNIMCSEVQYTRFFVVKTLVVIGGLIGRFIIYANYPGHISVLLDFFLACIVMCIFLSVSANVSKHLRAANYFETRTQQLSARLISFVAFAVNCTFILSTFFVDSADNVSTYVEDSVSASSLGSNVMLHVGSIVLLLMYLPPKSMLKAKDAELKQLPSTVSPVSNPSTYPFDPITACRMFNNSYFAYKSLQAEEDASIFNDNLNQQNLVLLKELYDSITDTRGLILREGNQISIAFRGTCSSTNAKTDLDMKFCQSSVIENYVRSEKNFSSFPNGDCLNSAVTSDSIKIHRGFWEAYDTVRDEMLSELESILRSIDHDELNNVQIYTTGHSLGGALATVAAMDISWHIRTCTAAAKSIWSSYKNGVIMYNFGSPRVGNYKFAKAYNSLVPNSYRIVNDGDMIVGNPKRSSFGVYCVSNVRYKHIGTAILLADRAIGSFIIDPNVIEKALIGRLKGSLSSHLMDSYKLKLDQGLQQLLNRSYNYQACYSV